MGIALATNVDKKPMLTLVSKAINLLFHEPKSPFLRAKVMDILYNGVPIDCESTEFAAVAVCSVLNSDEAPAVRPYNDTHHLFSMLRSVRHAFLCLWLLCASNEFAIIIQNVCISHNRIFRSMELILVNSKCTAA